MNSFDDVELDRSIRLAIAAAEPGSRQAFVAAITPRPADLLPASLWGEAPSAVERASAVLTNLRRQYEQRSEVVAESLTAAQVAGVLGVSEQAVLDRLKTRSLLGLRAGREWRVPAWQLSADAERGFLPGLAVLAAAFPGGVVSLSRWVLRPSGELSGRTPAAVLAAGDVEPVVTAAEVSTAAAW